MFADIDTNYWTLQKVSYSLIYIRCILYNNIQFIPVYESVKFRNFKNFCIRNVPVSFRMKYSKTS